MITPDNHFSYPEQYIGTPAITIPTGLAESRGWTRTAAAATLSGVLLLTAACSGSDETAPREPDAISADQSPSKAEKVPTTIDKGLNDPVSLRRASQIISTFENSTTELAYGYAENIGDGRGITAGRSGFCSGTGDMLMVVQQYTKTSPDNSLAKYLPPLREIDKVFADGGWTDPVASTEGLAGLIPAWESSAADEAFRATQDAVYKRLYLDPAIKLAKSVETADGEGIQTAIGQLILSDTLLQHGGNAKDPDGLPQIMSEATATAGPKPTAGAYLHAFLDVREQHLSHAADEDTRAEWLDSVPRVDALRQILDSDNPTLKEELVFDVYRGDHYELPAVK